MSKRKNRNRSAGALGGGGGSEPLQVNWVVIGAAVILVAAIALFSVQQSRQAAAVSGGDCTPSTKQWSTPPEMTIDPARQYTATVKMAKGGQFVIQLLADKAPVTVNSFVFLAREGYFDCVTFHRVLEGFMAQGGDSTGTGAGGPGYQFEDEFSDLKFDRAGLVAMANSNNPDLGITGTNGSQFFITYAEVPWLDGRHTIFGEVISGMDVVNGLTRRDPNTNPDFEGDVIESIAITEK